MIIFFPTFLFAFFGVKFNNEVRFFSLLLFVKDSSTPLTAKIKINIEPSKYSPIKKAPNEAKIINISTLRDLFLIVSSIPSLAL